MEQGCAAHPDTPHDRREKRKHVRVDVREAAFVRFGLNVAGAPCVIEDMSMSGARIDCGDVAMLPDRFTLEIGPRHRVPCEIVWQDGSRAGVRFIG